MKNHLQHFCDLKNEGTIASSWTVHMCSHAPHPNQATAFTIRPDDCDGVTLAQLQTDILKASESLLDGVRRRAQKQLVALTKEAEAR